MATLFIASPLRCNFNIVGCNKVSCETNVLKTWEAILETHTLDFWLFILCIFWKNNQSLLLKVPHDFIVSCQTISFALFFSSAVFQKRCLRIKGSHWKCSYTEPRICFSCRFWPSMNSFLASENRIFMHSFCASTTALILLVELSTDLNEELVSPLVELYSNRSVKYGSAYFWVVYYSKPSSEYLPPVSMPKCTQSRSEGGVG